MDLRKKILCVAILSSTGLVSAMDPAESRMLDAIERESYEQSDFDERWVGKFPDGKQIIVRRYLVDDSPSDSDPAMGDAFQTEQAKQNAFNFIRRKYFEQDRSFKLTQ
jgi:hypothetical protein